MKNVFRTLGSVLLLSSVAILVGCQTMDKPPWELPPGVKTATVNGYPMAFVERGSGPTVVLVHGALNDYRYWSPQLDSLSSRYRVVAVSLRHYYPEAWKGEGKFSIAQHSQDLAAFIARLGEGPVDVVGWSRGGTVAVDMAHSHPELIRKLVLMDPAIYELLPGGQKNDRRANRARETQAFFGKGQMEEGLRFYFDSINGPGAWDRLPADQRRNRLDNAWTVLGDLTDVETVTCEDIGRMQMPVLLMAGENSPAVLKNLRVTFQKCLPSAASVTIPNANHQMSRTNPAAFDAALIQFLSIR